MCRKMHTVQIYTRKNSSYSILLCFLFVFHPRWAHEQAGQAAAAASALANKPASASQPRGFFAPSADTGPPAALALSKPPDLPCIGEGLSIQSSHPHLSCGWWGFLLPSIFYWDCFVMHKSFTCIFLQEDFEGLETTDIKGNLFAHVAYLNVI